MAIQKNFVISNGLQVKTNLLIANATSNKVGIGTSVVNYKLHVNGGIGATTIYVSSASTITTLSGSNLTYTTANIGVGIVTSLSGTNLNYSGISTVSSFYIGANQVISSGRELQNIASLDATTTATIEAAIANAPNTFTDLTVTGISTLGVTSATNLTAQNLNVSGIGTIVNGFITNLTGTAATIGTVKISSGIVTASSGIVTYYGNGQYLDLSANTSGGIGIGTTGGVVGYGITFINFYGTGVSSSFYNTNAGIATIFFEGGGGSGTIGIGTVFPVSSVSGDLFFSAEFGRLFVYYDENVIGVGTGEFWVDAAPFNVGVITAIYGGVAFSDGSAAAPSWYFENDVTTGVFSPTNGQQTFVSVGSSILNINPNGINVIGVATIGNVTVGGATTDLIVNGSARVTGILTVGSSSLTLNGNTNTINGVIISSGIVTASSFVGALTGNATGLSGTPNLNVGVVTATSFIGNGSGLTGAGSTVFNDITTNQEFFPLFTSITTGTITASGISTSKLTYNPSTGTITASSFSSPGGLNVVGVITASSFSSPGGLNVVGVITCTDLNSTSDINLKENIHTVENALDTVNSLRGVSFDWKETGKSSYGVIAQELEEILPELVKQGEVKSVNYNGIIGVLIEAVKELKKEVEELKSQGL